MKKVSIGILTVILLIGLASAANSFGEVASLNACHCLMFNSTNTTHIWTLYSSYNTSVQFKIIKPSLTNVTIITSVNNGTINPDSYYPINVMVVSKSPINQSGYLAADVVSGATTSGGASISLGADKLIEVAANSLVKKPTTTIASNRSIPLTRSNITSSGGTAASTAGGASAVTGSNNHSVQQAASSENSAYSKTVEYLLVAVVVLVILAGSLAYYAIRAKGKGSRPKRRGKRK